MNSFFSDGIKAWNNVIGHFPNIPSHNILKDHILSLIRPEKKYFQHTWPNRTSIPLLFENELKPFEESQKPS